MTNFLIGLTSATSEQCFQLFFLHSPESYLIFTRLHFESLRESITSLKVGIGHDGGRLDPFGKLDELRL